MRSLYPPHGMRIAIIAGAITACSGAPTIVTPPQPTVRDTAFVIDGLSYYMTGVPDTISVTDSFDVTTVFLNRRPDTLLLSANSSCLVITRVWKQGEIAGLDGSGFGCIGSGMGWKVAPGDSLVRQSGAITPRIGGVPVQGGVYQFGTERLPQLDNREELGLPPLPALQKDFVVR